MRDLINAGSGAYINKNKIIGFTDAKGNSIMRLIKIKEEENKVLDYRRGKTAKTIIYLDDDFIVLSTVTVETLKNRYEE